MCIQEHTEIQPGQRSWHHCQPGMDRRLFLGEAEATLARLPIVISTDPGQFVTNAIFCYSYGANE